MFSNLLNAFQAGHNITEELYEIQHSFYCYSKYGTNYNVDIVDIQDGFSFYLAFMLDNFMVFDKNVPASLIKILEIINQFQPSNYPIISVSDIKVLLQAVDELGYMKIINAPRKLNIACTPYKRENNNSGYNLFCHLILCSSTEASPIHPYFIFLHEVGHAFITNLNLYKKRFNVTNDLGSLPLSLELLLEAVTNWTDDIYNWDKPGKKTDLFTDFAADMFAAAVCRSDRELQNYIPEYLNKNWLIDVFSFYFNEIMLLENPQDAFSSRFWSKERRNAVKTIIDTDSIAM